MKKILVIGDAILDHYVYGSIERKSPEDPDVDVLDILSEEYRPGGCLNVAVNLKTLLPVDYQIHLASVFSPFTGKLLEDYGVQADSSNMIDENYSGSLRPSTHELIKTRVINAATSKQLIRLDNRKSYHRADIDLFNDTLPPFNYFDVVVISDYCKGLIGPGVFRRLADSTKPLIFVDTKKSDLSLWDFSRCYVKINHHEYNKASNADKLHYLVVTKGSNGADLLCCDKVDKSFSVDKVSNIDVTGAGDVFLAGLVAGFMENNDLYEAITKGNKAASKSVERMGTTRVYRHEVF